LNIVENSEALDDLDNNMKDNIKTMKSNLESIRERFKKLKK